ncbi:MAG: radical SAM protein [Synergistaceae bacterium]|nr:radical SAM protein [Synergistaceae bacterium]
MIKKLLKAVLPVSVWNFLKSVKKTCRVIAVRLRLLLSLPLKKKLDRIEIGFHVAEHCNLNCAYCDNFSPLAEPEFIDVEEFRRDVERMALLFKGECERISLLGGEPLLHPRLSEIIDIARTNFPECRRLRLLTNGILLTQQKPSFWGQCHDRNVTLVITHYPINIDVAKIRELAEKFGVALEYSSMTKDEFLKEPINLSGNGDYRKNFALCSRGNKCIMLGHGHLFTCTFVSNVHHFNRKFGTNIPVTEADYIDIYKESDGEKILRRLAEPIPACRFCDMNFQSVEWRRSKQDISEWV